MPESGTPLELRLHRLWNGQGSAVLRGVLVAAAGVYRGALVAREACYGVGLFSTRRLPVPVISIGNVTLGGSGKTPLTAVVAATLRDLGARPAIVSRGYGRRTRGVHVVADQSGVHLAARDAGDEPRLLAEQLPGVPVVVGESRYEAGRVAVERCGADALVLDDGFQHRTLAKDLEILSVEGREPWGNGRLFPRGVLREPLSALQRANLVVVTNPPSPGAVQSMAWSLRRAESHAEVLSGSYRAETLRDPDGATHPPSAIGGRRVVALAGLASPAGFVTTLTSLGAVVAELLAFPDHHPYGATDLERVRLSARRTQADWVVTTEKDWVRLREVPSLDLPLKILSVRLDLGADSRALARALRETLRGKAVGRTGQ
jgi:tetraacyldisaccharide 4'-kinase